LCILSYLRDLYVPVPFSDIDQAGGKKESRLAARRLVAQYEPGPAADAADAANADAPAANTAATTTAATTTAATTPTTEAFTGPSFSHLSTIFGEILSAKKH